MFAKPRFFFGVVASVIIVSEDGKAQRVIPIKDTPVCSACRISITLLRRLAGNDSITLSRSSRVVIVGNTYVVTPTYTPAQIVVFDSVGSIVKTFGRRGRGPGEMLGGNTLRVAAGPGDSIHVVDQNRWLVFAPRTYDFVRSVNLPASPTFALIMKSGLLLAAFPWQPRSGHLFTASIINTEGQIVQSFDPLDSEEQGHPWVTVRSIDATDNAIWTARVNSTTIRRQSLTSGEVTVWQRKEGWFTGWTEYSWREPYLDPPRPTLSAVRSDGSTLWVHSQRADADWSPLRELEPPRGSEGMRRPTNVDPERFFDGVIEVIDAATGDVITRLVTREVWHPLMGQRDLVQRMHHLESGEIVIEIARLRMEGQ
jgi:hypothetical protein